MKGKEESRAYTSFRSDYKLRRATSGIPEVDDFHHQGLVIPVKLSSRVVK